MTSTNAPARRLETSGRRNIARSLPALTCPPARGTDTSRPQSIGAGRRTEGWQTRLVDGVDETARPNAGESDAGESAEQPDAATMAWELIDVLTVTPDGDGV